MPFGLLYPLFEVCPSLVGLLYPLFEVLSQHSWAVISSV